MNIIIEYLLNSAAAFAYAIQFPEVSILGKIAKNSNPTEAAMLAIRTKNRENALVLEDCHREDITWVRVFNEAVDIGNLSIARQLFPMCSWLNFDEAVYIAAYNGCIPMVEQLLEWGAEPSFALEGVRTGRVAKVTIAAKASGIGQAFIDAAREGRIGLMQALLPFTIPKALSERKTLPFVTGAYVSACAGGRVKAARYLLGLGVEIPLGTIGEAFEEAAGNGHSHVCKFMLNEHFLAPARDEHKMEAKCARAVLRRGIKAAAGGGYAHAVETLWDSLGPTWSKHFADNCLDFAAEYGGARVVRGIRTRIQAIGLECDYNRLLVAATRGNRVRVMLLAKEWGATNFGAAIPVASEEAQKILEGRIREASLVSPAPQSWLMW